MENLRLFSRNAMMLLCALLATALLAPHLRVAIATLVVFGAPGFVLSRVVSSGSRFSFETAVQTIGLSIAAIIIMGLLLHPLGGITQTGWRLALAAVCLFAALSESWRAPAAAEETPAASEQTAPAAMASWSPFDRMRIAVTLGLVTVLAGSAVILARSGASAHRQFSYTELWMLPSRSGIPNRVTVGVRNQEKRPVVYDLELTLNDKIVNRHSAVALADGEQKIEEFATPVDGSTPRQHIEMRLYLNGSDPVLYRHVSLTTQREDLRDANPDARSILPAGDRR